MALALFDLDETLIAGDSASLWLEVHGGQGWPPAGMIAEEQAMMSLYHQGKMDMHQYMAFTLQPLAGRSCQWLDPAVPPLRRAGAARARLYPEGLARIEWHRQRATSWCSSPPPASIWWRPWQRCWEWITASPSCSMKSRGC